ncbi:hypothetical protein [Scytonema millei]|uniref:Uncharacterized protein n=1 Tax=Scytonema millei VB511283 TaxID=1245923 RepID=A0A9X5I2K8_9CYAN|nr:hypothetical protein [Scytonema millei]NHC33091.1 hypothetical protein [Scytonema millei VB511283]
MGVVVKQLAALPQPTGVVFSPIPFHPIRPINSRIEIFVALWSGSLTISQTAPLLPLQWTKKLHIAF